MADGVLAATSGGINDAIESVGCYPVLDDLYVLPEQVTAKPGEVGIRELVPAAARGVRSGLRVACQRDAATKLLRELPDVRVLLHLDSREMRAAADVAPPAAIELCLVPASEPAAEDAALRGDLTQRMLLVRHP